MRIDRKNDFDHEKHGVAFLVLVLCLSVCTGCSRPAFEIVSASMEPKLRARARIATCTHCGRSVRYPLSVFRAQAPMRCYVCGHPCRLLSPNPVAGDTVRVVPLGRDEPLHRWDIIAFNSPSDDRVMVKRVWALPGERLELRDGECWIDGRMLQKDLGIFFQLGITVADYPEYPAGRWLVGRSESKTELNNSPTNTFTPFRLPQGSTLEWTFCIPSARLEPDTEPPLEPSGLIDDLPENQGASYAYRPVADWGTHIELSRPLDAPLTVELNSYGRQVTLTAIPPKGESSQAFSTTKCMPDARTSQTPVCSNQLQIRARKWLKLVVCDRRILAQSDLESPPPTPIPTPETTLPAPTVMRICSQGEIELKRIRLIRDLYLRTAYREADQVQIVGNIPDRYYFVIGDNVPVSVDSRNGLGLIPRESIIGRVQPE